MNKELCGFSASIGQRESGDADQGTRRRLSGPERLLGVSDDGPKVGAIVDDEGRGFHDVGVGRPRRFQGEAEVLHGLRRLRSQISGADQLAFLVDRDLSGRVDRAGNEIIVAAVDDRLRSLQKEVQETEERLKRLYRGIEDGVIELDDILRDRAAVLK